MFDQIGNKWISTWMIDVCLLNVSQSESENAHSASVTSEWGRSRGAYPKRAHSWNIGAPFASAKGENARPVSSQLPSPILSFPAFQLIGKGGRDDHWVAKFWDKMEVCERLLCLAVVSSVLCVGSVLGKYVRGIVNTKEVRCLIPNLSLVTMTPL